MFGLAALLTVDDVLGIEREISRGRTVLADEAHRGAIENDLDGAGIGR